MGVCYPPRSELSTGLSTGFLCYISVKECYGHFQACLLYINQLVIKVPGN
jgi:hypothetical protein